MRKSTIAGALLGVAMLAGGLADCALAQGQRTPPGLPAATFWLKLDQPSAMARARAAFRERRMRETAEADETLNKWEVEATGDGIVAAIKCIADDDTDSLVNPNARRVLVNITVANIPGVGIDAVELRYWLAEYMRNGKAPMSPVSDFGGTWNTDADGFKIVLTLKQVGNRVTGEYPFGKGMLSGVVIRDTLYYTWTQDPNRSGEGFFKMKPGGKSFDGKWTERGEEKGNWVGTKSG